MSDTPTCDKCGIPCTTGMMAAYCSQGRECVFWPHSNGEMALAGGELLMYRFWMDNTLEQIGLQIEDRKRLERELEEARLALSKERKWIPVSERLPEESDPMNRQIVLAWFEWRDGGRAERAEISCGHWRPESGNGNFDSYVTHWMPLPSAPEAK